MRFLRFDYSCFLETIRSAVSDFGFLFKKNNINIGDSINIKGIISKIEYLKSLEVNAIWLSPIFKSPMNDMGYDVSDYFDIDPLFGNMDDFEELINICNKNGFFLE